MESQPSADSGHRQVLDAISYTVLSSGHSFPGDTESARDHSIDLDFHQPFGIDETAHSHDGVYGLDEEWDRSGMKGMASIVRAYVRNAVSIPVYPRSDNALPIPV